MMQIKMVNKYIPIIFLKILIIKQEMAKPILQSGDTRIQEKCGR